MCTQHKCTTVQVQCAHNTAVQREVVSDCAYNQSYLKQPVRSAHPVHNFQSKLMTVSTMAVLSCQRWPQRAQVKHKYPREVFNWRREQWWIIYTDHRKKIFVQMKQIRKKKCCEDVDEETTITGILYFKQFWSLASSYCTLDSCVLGSWSLVLFWDQLCHTGTLWCTVVVKKPSHNFFRSAEAS